jgi:hypothetical protein
MLITFAECARVFGDAVRGARESHQISRRCIVDA